MSNESEEWVKNPIIKFRNVKCICLSGKKTKKCCGIYPHWKRSLVEMYEQFMEGDISDEMFLTQLRYEKSVAEEKQ